MVQGSKGFFWPFEIPGVQIFYPCLVFLDTGQFGTAVEGTVFPFFSRLFAIFLNFWNLVSFKNLQTTRPRTSKMISIRLIFLINRMGARTIRFSWNLNRSIVFFGATS